MLERRSFILLLCGLAGLLSYILLRPDIDLYSSGAITQSKETVESNITELAPLLGFSVDSLAVMSMRRQHVGYIKKLQDTLENKVKPGTLNQEEMHIQSWETIIGLPKESNGFFASTNQLFDSIGRLKLHVSNSGKIIRIEAHSENPNPTFLQGDSLLALATNLTGTVLGYNLNDYELNDKVFTDSTIQLGRGKSPRELLRERNTRKSETLDVIWIRVNDSSKSPQKLVLSLKPVVREFNNEAGFRTEFGFSIQSFIASNEFEPIDLKTTTAENDEDNLVFSYMLFSILIVLASLIFAVGVKNIFKGKVEWRRALFMFTVIALAMFGWREIYFMNSYNPFLSNAGIFGATINSLIFGIVVGVYAALAYISWEALARSQKEKQLDVIDALWQRNFFVKETGAGLIHGFAIGGIAIGIISSILFLMGEFLIQADSQFGFSEAGISQKLLTMNMSSWTTTWLVCIAQIGFVHNILKHWIKKEYIAAIFAILLSCISITVLGRLIGTTGSVFHDIWMYFGLAVIFIYALREFGLLTVCTGWWFFTIFFMTQPYWGSPAIDVAYVGWVQAFFMAGPLIYGFIAYRYGISVSEVADYIPEYEERITQQLRVEKEIEIARESQYKLMPLLPPKAEGVDVYGFFLPSFEVGGDYFDYVLTHNNEGRAVALTMAVVDVSGKAMRAAMPAVFTSGLLLSRMKDDMPEEVLSQITEPIFSRTDKRTFITCALARYDFESMKMIIANAGHCRPILKRNGLAEYIRTPEPAYPLGIKESVTYRSEIISMKKGDFFLMYSDGLPEAVNEKGDRFGFDEVPRLIESIDTENLTAQEIAQEIKRTVQKYSNYQLADDTTIICLKI